MRLLFIVFIVVPLLEMWILIKVGGVIGALPTIALVVLTAIAGLALLRQQGFSTLMRANERLDEGSIPAQELLEGVLIAIGAVLLLTPGFITDALGLACLLPPTRRWLVREILRRGLLQAAGARSTTSSVGDGEPVIIEEVRFGHTRGNPNRHGGQSRKHRPFLVIDGECERDE